MLRNQLRDGRGRATGRRSDAGVTLPELLVAMLISAAVIGVGIALVSFTGRMMTSSQASAKTIAQLQDASTQLMRDVQDGRKIIEASPTRLVLEVVRDSACVLTTWEATEDGTLDVTRLSFTMPEGQPGDPACADSGGERTHRTVVDRFESAEAPFAYFSRASTEKPLDVPVITDDVARITWTLTSSPAYPADADSRTVSSGGALAQRTGTSGSGAVGDARSPLLAVTTTHEGVGQPHLTWNDPTPTLTDTWTIFRISYPEGGTASGTWEALITLPGSQDTYTDTGLPAGHTARYLVRATLTDGRTGPTSNQVATGVRPAPVTLTATGQDTGILVEWTAAPGATAYDLYRDGTLYRTSLSGTSYTDATGRGHSHAYRVVPVNRWERCATRAAKCTEGNQSYQVPTTTADSASLPGGSPTATRRLSTANAAAGAFTSPSQPSLDLTANANWSNTLTWAPNATWTGSGPTTKGGVHRDRGWVARVSDGHGSTAGTFPTSPNVWSGAENPRTQTARAHQLAQATVAGQYRHYQVRTCNDVGCSPWSSTERILQRPPAPTCTAAKTGITTRQVQVSITRPAMLSSYTSNQVRLGVSGGTTPLYEGGATSYTHSTLAHSTTHWFDARTRNGSPANDGWSDPSAGCSATTDPLRVSIASTSSTTRSVSGSASATNGTSRTMTLEGVETQPGTSFYHNYLTHNYCFTLTARNSDGYNEVVDQRGVCTPRLYVAPAFTPSCNAWADSPYAPTTVHFSTNGNELSRSSVYAGSGGYYSATATQRNRNNDGFNYVESAASSSCGTTVQSMPTPNTGAGGGAPSGVCAAYRSIGAVTSLLNAAGTAPGAGFYTGGPSSGSYAADYGSHVGGSVAGGDLSCVFYRDHPIYFAFNNMYVGEYTVSARWNMSAGGAV